MEVKTFHRLQWFLFWFCHTPNIIILILRVMIQYDHDQEINDWLSNEYQFQYLQLSTTSMNIAWLKIAIYAVILLTCCQWCCVPSLRIYRLMQYLYFIDMVGCLVLVIDIPLERDTLTPDGHKLNVYPVNIWEIFFLICMGIMVFIDFFYTWLYKAAIENLFYYDDGITQPLLSSGQRSSYQGYAPISPTPNPPRRSPTKVQRPPRDLHVAGLQDSSLVLTNENGDLIFVREIVVASTSNTSLRGITQTQVALITREAMERNPLNPEVRVLTTTEVTGIDFGTEQQRVNRALGLY